jgi:hypothetical protein
VPTGGYSQTEYDGVRAFKLLVHAEIESYLEDFGIEVLDAVEGRWLEDAQARKALLGLLAFAEHDVQGTPDEVQVGPSTIVRTVQTARKTYSNFARRTNNGIAQKNVLALLLPVGVREVDLSPSWLQRMDAFGQHRGQFAHTSYAAQTPPDPSDARRDVVEILIGLRRLDLRLISLRDE